MLLSAEDRASHSSSVTSVTIDSFHVETRRKRDRRALETLGIVSQEFIKSKFQKTEVRFDLQNIVYSKSDRWDELVL